MLLKSHGLYEITKGEKEDPDGALGQCTIMFLEDEQEPAKEAELEAASEVEGEQRERDKEEGEETGKVSLFKTETTRFKNSYLSIHWK